MKTAFSLFFYLALFAYHLQGRVEFTVTNEDETETIEVTEGKFRYGVQENW